MNNALVVTPRKKFAQRFSRFITLTAPICASAVVVTAAQARPILESTCPGGIPSQFVRACDAHASQGYAPFRRQLADGSCINMCCQQDANGNISCVSDPSKILSRSPNAATPSSSVPGPTAPMSPAPRATTPTAPGVLPNAK